MRAANDIAGMRFGKLTAIQRVAAPRTGISSKSAYWLCICECGAEKIIMAQNLRSGASKSCGCWQREHMRVVGKSRRGKATRGRLNDVSGQIFGDWTVIRMIPGGGALCRCRCGTERVVNNTTTLRKGLSTGCGCTKILTLIRIKTKHGNARQNQPDLRWARRVKERDNHTCLKCGKPNLSGKDEHAHHMLPVKHFPDLRYDLANGQTLCASCHTGETNREKVIYATAD